MQIAVCAIIYNEKHEVLAVSRRDNRALWCLPGGKVEQEDMRNDTIYVDIGGVHHTGMLPGGFRTAVAREIEEETGLIRRFHQFHVLFCGVGSLGTLMFVFGLREIISSGVKLTAETDVKWMQWKELISLCPFKDVLMRMEKHPGVVKPLAIG